MQISPGWQRAIGAAVVLPTAALSLPVSAMFLDHPQGRENWILPALPGSFGSSVGHGRGALLGAAAGIGAAALADVAFFMLLN